MAEKSNTHTGAPEGLTKLEAVRRALASLGEDARPTLIKEFVKQHFNIDMSTDHASAAKVKVLRKKAGQGKSAAGKAAAHKSAARKTPAKKAAVKAQAQPPARTKASGSMPLDDILTLKHLVKAHGAEPLRALINAFTR